VHKALRQLVVFAATVFSSSTFGDYVANRVDYVDSVTGATAPFSQLWSLNNNGQAIGFAGYDGTGATGFYFVYDPVSGNYFPIPQPPGFDGTTTSANALSINDAGVVTGTTFEPAGDRGFILADGVYTFFSNPAWINTNGRTIGNPTVAHPQGFVVGYLDNGLFQTSDGSIAFVYDPVTSRFLTFDETRSFKTIAQGQNAAGQFVGDAWGDGVVRARGPWGFLFTPATAGDPMLGGTFSFFRIDGKRTRPRGINDKGVIAASADYLVPGGLRTYIGVPGNFQLLNVPSITGLTCLGGSPTSAVALNINNAGQVAGWLTDSACKNSGYIATPASLPTGTSRNGAATFNVNVAAGEPMFINLPVAPGYDYAVGKHDPRFASVRLPIGIGSNKFVLVVGRRAFALNAGQLFDFREHGFRKGVKAFRVACVDPAAIDAANPSPFPTGLTFAKAGTFTGTQKPRAAAASEHDDDGEAPSTHPLTQAECRQRLLALRDAGGPNEDDNDD
jgi:hypothetical protein